MSQPAKIVRAEQRFAAQPARDEAIPLPPYSEDAEEIVCADILSQPDSMALAVMERLEPDHFFIVRYGWIYGAMLDLYRDGNEINYISVVERLKALRRLEEVGGPAAITQLIGFRVSPGWSTATRASARTIRQDAERRAWLTYASELARAAYDRSGNIVKQWSDLGRAWMDLRPFEPNQDFVTGVDSVAVYEDMVRDARANRTWFSVPYAGLAERRPVLLPGEIVVIVGPEGGGKSAMLYGWAEYYASEENARVVYIHTEMTKADVFDRRIAAHTKVAFARLMRKEELTETEVEQIEVAGIDMARWIHNLDYWHAGQVDAPRLLAAMDRLVQEYGTQIFILDYLNDIVPQTDNRTTEAVGYRNLLAKIEEFANRTGTVVVTAAQLNAEGGAFQIGRALKQKAALYLKITLEELEHEYAYNYDGVPYKYLPGEMSPEATIRIEKNRKGRGGTFPMFYVGPRYLWVDMSAPGLKRSLFVPVINRRADNDLDLERY